MVINPSTNLWSHIFKFNYCRGRPERLLVLHGIDAIVFSYTMRPQYIFFFRCCLLVSLSIIASLPLCARRRQPISICRVLTEQHLSLPCRRRHRRLSHEQEQVSPSEGSYSSILAMSTYCLQHRFLAIQNLDDIDI